MCEKTVARSRIGVHFRETLSNSSRIHRFCEGRGADIVRNLVGVVDWWHSVRPSVRPFVGFAERDGGAADAAQPRLLLMLRLPFARARCPEVEGPPIYGENTRSNRRV